MTLMSQLADLSLVLPPVFPVPSTDNEAQAGLELMRLLAETILQDPESFLDQDRLEKPWSIVSISASLPTEHGSTHRPWPGSGSNVNLALG